MYAMIGLMKKAEGMSAEDYRRWWIDEHAPRVAQMPGLIDYVIYPIDATLNLQTGSFEDYDDYDGIAVTTWESKEAFLAAHGQRDVSSRLDSFKQGGGGVSIGALVFPQMRGGKPAGDQT